MKMSFGLIALGAALAVLCFPPTAWTDYIGLWWGLSCVLGGAYGIHREHAKRSRAKAAVQAMAPEQSLFLALQSGCPECGKKAGFYNGPEGGMSMNVYCCNPECRQGYNISPTISRAEKIGRTPPFKYPEDFRDVKLDGTPKDKPAPAQTVVLTRKQIERTNVHRRLSKRPMLSAEGFRAATLAAPAPSGQGENDWLLYFMIWQAVDSSHISTREDIGTGLRIDHVSPGGGEFGGAGATASWTDTYTPTFNAAIAATAATAALTSSSSPSDSSSSDSSSSPSRSESDATPSVSPSQSYSTPSSDSYSSSSSDSYSSSSSDSGSSGGGDSGGGGGGGGGGD